MAEDPQNLFAGRGSKRSPLFGLGLLMLAVWLGGWWVSSYRPMSFGCLGNPRVDGYLAAGCLILDIVREPSQPWQFETANGVPLKDLSELEYSGYRSKARWWRISIRAIPEVAHATHFQAGFPALILIHLLLWGGVEAGWGRRWRRLSAAEPS